MLRGDFYRERPFRFRFIMLTEMRHRLKLLPLRLAFLSKSM